MEPIVSPWFFYWVSVLDSAVVPSIMFAVVSSLATFISFIVGWLVPDGEREARQFKLICKIVFPIALLAILIAMLMPSEKTMYRMLIASHTTPQNIEKVVELADKIKDDIKQDVIDVIKEVKE